jgi:hypothetical protein
VSAYLPGRKVRRDERHRVHVAASSGSRGRVVTECGRILHSPEVVHGDAGEQCPTCQQIGGAT